MHDAILTMLTVVDWLANDLHYQFEGKGFYENHLLADRVRDFGSAKDDYRETYWLGFLGKKPPLDKDIAGYAVRMYDTIVGRNPCLLTRLYDGLSVLADQVEVCKKDAIPGGVQAILDDISQKALTYKFLVRSEMKLDESDKTDTESV